MYTVVQLEGINQLMKSKDIEVTSEGLALSLDWANRVKYVILFNLCKVTKKEGFVTFKVNYFIGSFILFGIVDTVGPFNITLLKILFFTFL